MAKRSRVVGVLFLGISAALAYFSLVLLTTRAPEEAPVVVSAIPAVPTPPIPTDSPREWPYLRFLEFAQGTWESNNGTVLTIEDGRKAKKREWTLSVSGRLLDGGPPTTCTMSPELKDGGFYGKCDTEDFYIRLRMNQDKKLYAECIYFEYVFTRRR